jgi:hypothetical protein
MVRLKELELMMLFRHPGGDEFALFCTEVIRAACWAGGIPGSAVSSTTRTDARDGGVDTRVDRRIPGDKSGYFEHPTIWQFKAADEAHVSIPDMGKEISKPYAKACIQNGDAYRLCICDHLTPEKKIALTAALEKAVMDIRKDAPPPVVLGIADITVVANFYPGLVMQYRPDISGAFTLFERWKERMNSVTRTFVSGERFEKTKATILNHVDLSQKVKDPILTLYGQAGVGKTRTTYESLCNIPAASSIVMYFDDEEAVLEFATRLDNSVADQGIIVADECSIATREQLSRKLTACSDRVRCICIDNSKERVASPAPELAVEKMTVAELESILKANFPGVASDRVRIYAQISEGFVRLAADMCANLDPAIKQAGSMSPILGKVDEYYRTRLTGKEKFIAVETIALLKRVKHKGDSPTELERICALVEVDRKEVEQALSEVKDAPGWVERGALYYRITPELIAMIAFEAAWNRFARGREEDFLKKLPEEIQASFLERVSESGSTEVREIVQRFFQGFANSFGSKNLADPGMVNKLISLIETDPNTYLPVLRRVVASAEHDELTSTTSWFGGSWGTRREIVWLAERFVQFPEFFSDCEEILFVLAQHECEPDIGNNATKTWQHLFRLQLSGTSIPLHDRLKILLRRLESATSQTADIIGGALGNILDTHGTRVLGPPVVGGRIPPQEWTPATWDEFREEMRGGFNFIQAAVNHPVKELALGAKKALLIELESYTRQGWVDELRQVISVDKLDETDRARLVSRLKNILAFGKHPQGTEFKNEYAEKLTSWIEELQPKSLHARLVEFVGSRSWDHYGREKEWESGLRELAMELQKDPNVFASELVWLTSSEASSSFELGHILATLDMAPIHLDAMVQASKQKESALLRGYVSGLIFGAKVDPEPINKLLDQLEKDDPQFSFQIALAGGSPVRVFERAISLVTSKRIPVYNLRVFTHWVGNEHITLEQVIKALEILLPWIKNEEKHSSDVAIEFLGARFHAGQFNDLLTLNKSLVWNVLAATTKNISSETYWWGELLKAAAPTSPQLAISLACNVLVGDNYGMADEAKDLLSTWASEYPDEVMSELGKLMLNDKTGIRFYFSKLPVFTVLPADVVIRWLDNVGVEGAWKIARNLPKPFLDQNRGPVVPELTKYVLSKFEEDDRVFNEFSAGTHSHQIYAGDFGATRLQEGENARPFIDHPLRRIREWAQHEMTGARQDAQRHREWEKERGF